jgi:hypothetical protein
MADVPGVNGITGFVVSDPEAPPFQVMGGPADPMHGQPGETAEPYPWEIVPMGPYPGSIDPLPGMVDDRTAAQQNLSAQAGYLAQDPTADQTPAYHAAPFSTEGPNALQADQMDVRRRNAGSRRQLLNSLWLHAHNTGASLRRLFDFTYGSKQDNWVGFFNPIPGEDIVPTVPGSVGYQANGFGVNDHMSNAFRKQNAYGFDTAHRHRRYAYSPIPGNTMWMKPGGRPMVRSFTGQHNFPTSGAFAGDDPGYTFGYQGAVLTNTPSEYVAPPQPNLGSALVNADTAPYIPLY